MLPPQEHYEYLIYRHERALELGYDIPIPEGLPEINYDELHYFLWATIARIIKRGFSKEETIGRLIKLSRFGEVPNSKPYLSSVSLPAYKKLGLRLFYSGRYRTLIAYETVIYKTKKLLTGQRG